MGGADLIPADFGLSREEIAALQAMKARDQYGVNLGEKDIKPRPDEKQQMAALAVVTSKYEIVRVRSMGAFYYREKDVDGCTYKKCDDGDLDLKRFVKEAYRELGVVATGRKIANTVDTLKEQVDEEVETIDTNIIEIGDGWYWDGHESKITQEPSGKCFVRLFDNSGQTSPSTINIDKEDIIPKYIKGIYKNTLKWLEMLDGNMPTPDMEKEIEENGEKEEYPITITFDFINTWACGRSDVYNDMLKAAATIFMKNKPVGAFILTGLKRNGKSTYVKMLHTMLGRSNTSALRLADLSSRHRTLTLLTSMMNAPDEETEGKDMDDEATANFKSMSAHEPVLLPVMYSSKPQWISTNFTMFCPMNTDPEWKGNSASACNQRSLIIPFHADLSKFDNSGKDFARETFTAYMYNDLLGVLFAIATYYKDKPLEFGETMMQAKQAVEEATDNRLAYAKLFTKWFCGYRVIKDVWVDYRAWCNAYGYECVNQKSLSFAISNLNNGTKRTRVVKDYSDTPISVIRLGNTKGDNFFIADEYLPELKSTIKDVLYINGTNDFSGNSVVLTLERWLESQSLNKIREEARNKENGVGDGNE